MSPLARALLALVAAALLHGACAESYDAIVSLGTTKGAQIVTLPKIHVGSSVDFMLTIPNDCDPYGYSRMQLVGTLVIIRNSALGEPPMVIPTDPDDPQADLEVHCAYEWDDFQEIYRCDEGLDVISYQFCNPLIE